MNEYWLHSVRVSNEVRRKLSSYRDGERGGVCAVCFRINVKHLTPLLPNHSAQYYSNIS